MTTPIVPGVNLPSALQEVEALLYWNLSGPQVVMVPAIANSVALVVVLEPRPHSHGLVLAVTQRLPEDAIEPGRDWLDDLTLRGYRTAVCAGFLEAQKTILDYLKS